MGVRSRGWGWGGGVFSGTRPSENIHGTTYTVHRHTCAHVSQAEGNLVTEEGAGSWWRPRVPLHASTKACYPR